MYGKSDRVLFGATIALVVFVIVCANPFNLYFLNDDFIHIPLAAKGNFLHGNLLRPVSDLSLWIDSALWGKNAAGFHFTNLLLHFANSVLLFVFLKRFTTKDDGKVLFASALFLVYAFHSESVFWIIGRGGSLSALFILIALNCYAFSKSAWSMLMALLSFAIGLLTYESIWILPFVVLSFQIHEYYVNKRKPAWRWSVSFVILFIGYLALRFITDRVYISNYEFSNVLSGDFQKLIYNFIATVARAFLPPMENADAFLILTIAFFIFIAISFFLAIRQRSLTNKLLLPFVCMLMACLPTISLGIDTHDTEGERFLYVPSLFCCWYIGEHMYILIKSNAIRKLCLSLILLFHCFFFYRSSQSYMFAGKTVVSSLDCIRSSEGAKVLHAIDVPTQYKGALIFRTGFEQAVHWMMPGKFDSVIVNSGKEFYNRGGAFSCDVSDFAGDKTNRTVTWSAHGWIRIQ